MSEPVFPVGWITAENVESDTVPPFAVVEIRSIDQSTGIAKIGKPAADDQVTVFFNGPAPILPGHKGQVHQTMPCIAAYLADGDAGADPAHGEEWGTVADSWHLHEGHTGFTIIGAGGFGLCNVQRSAVGDGSFWARITEIRDQSPTWTEHGWIERVPEADGAYSDGDRTGHVRANVRIKSVQDGNTTTLHEKQSIAIIGATGGTFTLTFDGQTTSALAYNLSAGTLETALEALSNLTSVTVTGSGTYAAPFVVEFLDNFDNEPIMTADYTNLTPDEAVHPAYEVSNRTARPGEVVRLWPGFGGDYRFKGPVLPTGLFDPDDPDGDCTLLGFVTDVTWDEETCEMTKTTKTLCEIIAGVI